MSANDANEPPLACVFCGSLKAVEQFKGKLLCGKCADELFDVLLEDSGRYDSVRECVLDNYEPEPPAWCQPP